MAAHNEFGLEGEDKAVNYLIREGYLILDRNWKSGHKELDIVAEKDGMLVVVMAVSAETHECLAEPELVTRGFIYVKDSEDLLQELKQVAMESVDNCVDQGITDVNALKAKMKSSVATFLFKKTKCSPIILPVLFEL